MPRSLDGTLSGVAIRTKTSQISSDWLQDPRTGLTLPVSPVSFLVVPLVYESEVVALLGAHATRLDAFDEQDVELLSMLADVGAKRLAHAAAEEVGRVREKRPDVWTEERTGWRVGGERGSNGDRGQVERGAGGGREGGREWVKRGEVWVVEEGGVEGVE